MSSLNICNMNNESIVSLSSEKSFEVSFKADLLTTFPKTKSERVAILVTNEYEGIYKNGGIGTYYTTLSQKLAAEGWYVMLLLCNSEGDFKGESTIPALKHIFSTYKIERFLNLQSIHLAMLDEVKLDVIDYQSFCCLFFIQAVVNSFKDACIYAEFHEMSGIGYRSIQAKGSALLGRNCITAVTIHSGHEWIFEANERYVNDYSSFFWRFYHYEQSSFENADLSFFPSYYLKSKVESYGWKAFHAIHLPYFIPLLELPVQNEHNSNYTSSDLNVERIPVVFFGRLEERKGLCTFLEAIKLLHNNLSKKIHIIFVGKVVQLYSADLKHFNSQQHIEQELGSEFLYSIYPDFFSKEAIEFITKLQHSIVCLTSPQENFPNSALEMGQLPVSLVVSDTGGFRETLKLLNRSSGVHWFHPGNSQSLSKVIAQAVSAYPENPQTPDRAFVDQVNQNLFIQRIKHINQAISKPVSTEVYTTKVTIGVTSWSLGKHFLDCLQAVSKQTYKYIEVIVLEDAFDEDDYTQEAIAQAKLLFPNYKFVRFNTKLSLEAAQNYFVEIAEGEYFLPFYANHIALPFMVEKLVGAIGEANVAAVVCPHVKIGANIETFNFMNGSLPNLMNFNKCVDVCCFFSLKLLREFKLNESKNILSHNWHILAGAVATGKRIAYYPYPVYLCRGGEDAIISNTSLLRERYYLCQYLSRIEPSKWTQRQIYMLLTAVQQLLQSEEQLRCQITTMQTSRFWKLRTQWLKVKKILGSL